MDNSFVYETSNKRKIKVFILTLIFVIILGVIGLMFQLFIYKNIRNTLFVNFIISHITKDITTFTPLGIFYVALIGSNIFVPMPMEFIFYYALFKGGSIPLLFVLAITGIILSQMVNYWLGLKCSPLLTNFISAGKLYKARRIVNKWGAMGILFTSLIPAPAEIVTFSLGLAKYNKLRLFLFTLLGNIIKYSVIIGIFMLSK